MKKKNVSASESSKSASSRMGNLVADLIRAKVPSQTPALPERAVADWDILEETFFRMLKIASSDGASETERLLGTAIERSSLFNFL